MENFKPENIIENKEYGLISKDFFNFQFQFTKELYAKIKKKNPEIQLSYIIKNTEPMLRSQVLDYDEEKKDFLENFKDGITEENIADKAYDEYVKSEKELDRSTVTGPIQKFGPMFYLTSEDENINQITTKNNISFHFSNDFNMSPRELLNINERKIDIANLLKDIKINHPNTETISTASWLLDAIPDKIMEELFPKSFIKSIRLKESKSGWSLGTMIWGQFLDAKGGLKKDLAEKILQNLRNMKEDEYLIDLLEPPLHKPKSAKSNIQDFYNMYAV